MLEGGKRPAPIENLQLAMERLAGIREELTGWATAEIEFDFNPAGTDLFSMFELAFGYAKRSDDLCQSIDSLLKTGHIVPATIVARALIETIAMGVLYLAEMDRLIAHGQLEKLKKRLTSFWGGSRHGDVKPIHVNDALRHFETVDAAYVRYLYDKYPLFGELLASLEEAGGKSEPIEKLLSAMSNYDFLSEISHPNGVGVQFIYPQLAGIDEKI